VVLILSIKTASRGLNRDKRIKGTFESPLISPVLGKTVEDNVILGSAMTIYLDSCQPKTYALVRPVS